MSEIPFSWRLLAAVIGCISIVGLAMGLTIPLVSLVLEHRGYSSSAIGLVAAMPALGLLLFSPLVPKLVVRWGAQRAMFSSLIVGGLIIILFPLLDYFMLWLILRLLLGMVIGVLFIISETWINQMAEEHNRGKLIAIYATVFSLCFAAGPLLIIFTGSQGVAPFAIACVILSIAALPLFWAKVELPFTAGHAGFGVLSFFHMAPTLCAAVLVFAFIDSTSLALLPLFGLRHGHSETIAALMASVLIAGNIALQLPIGWVADRVNRFMLLSICGSLILVLSLLLPISVHTPAVLWPLLIVLGASAGGVYTLAMTLVGQRFKGAELITANAAFGVLWGIGSLVGPLFSGIAMRFMDPNGLAFTWVLVSAVFLGIFYWRHVRGAH